MDIRHDVSLRDYSTMRLGGKAAHIVEVSTVAELEEALAWAAERKLPTLMIGDGSNIVWHDDGFQGLVIVNQFKGFAITPQDDGSFRLQAAAGENWDSVVARSVEVGMTGIEYLSLIPGTAGATPVQNVGAYYQDIGSVLIEVEAYDTQASQVVTIPKADCQLAYRTSRFKRADRGRFYILSISIRLEHKNPEPPFYPSVQTYLDEHDIHDYTPQSMRQAIIDIRRSKLPDPAYVANNGSFFANPFVDQATLDKIEAEYGPVLHWPTDDGRMKIPAAWLIEKAGFKNFHDSETGMATWPSQPLVLVNEHAQSTQQLIAFRQRIQDTILDKFGIRLEQEPELLPDTP